MVRKLIEWAINSPLVVVLLGLTLVAVGTHAFLNVNVEAYPDPAPAIIEVIAQYPGYSAEEVERRVTVPLETALGGMPGLKYTRSKSLAGLAHLRNQFEYSIDFSKARQEVINRIQSIPDLPAGVTPQISPATPTGEIYRYVLRAPKDALGRGIYTLNDLKALQDWTLERQFRRIPRIADVSSFGGTVKRYEIQPDPDRLKRYGITLQQLQDAVAKSNGNVGGGILRQGNIVHNVRVVGNIGGGLDPMQLVLGLQDEPVRPEFLGTLAGAPGAGLPGALPWPALLLSVQSRPPAPVRAAAILRAEEQRRVQEIRKTVVASVNNIPIHVEDLVEGGPIVADAPSSRGVIVSYQERFGKISINRPRTDDNGRELKDSNGTTSWLTDFDAVQGLVLLRKNEESLPALRDVEAKVKELNENPGRLLPGVQIEPYYDRTELIGVTTETVRENLGSGMLLVSLILLMFLGNVRIALIVAINIPLALLFAFAVLFLRGKSANLLSIGAVDFGIIVDSTVIMVENIYRHITSHEHSEMLLKERILQATGEVERSLFFSTIIMVCALLPLFTMQGPEGQIFGPMADTYAFALGGALLLALTISPVLCLLLFSEPVQRLAEMPGRLAEGCFSSLLPPTLLWKAGRVWRWLWGAGAHGDNFIVRGLKAAYLWQLRLSLNFRWLSLGFVGVLLLVTLFAGVPNLGREFMPELEEGNMYVRGTFPLNISLEEVSSKVANPRAGARAPNARPNKRSQKAEAILADAQSIIRKYPEVQGVVAMIGRPDDGTDPTGFYNVEIFVPVKPEKDWPALKEQKGWQAWLDSRRPRTKQELVDEINAELNRSIPGVDWNFSQNIRDNVMESLSGVKGDNSVKIFGPDIDKLEEIAERVKSTLESVPGIDNVGIFHILGQSNLDIGVDRAKCARFGISVGDVQNVIDTAVRGKAFTSMIEGEKTFDVTLRLPERLRGSVADILKIPVDVTNNTIVSGPGKGVSASGTSLIGPDPVGSMNATFNTNVAGSPRRALGELVSPLRKDGSVDPQGTEFVRPGASTIYREQGNRLIAVKFSVRGRDLGSAVAEARARTHLDPPYRAEWSGEFQEMEEAERRLVKIVSLSLALIMVLLFLAFGSFLDAIVVFANVLAMSVGGVWALLLSGLNFNISAAVGFISILGVAIMNGLLMVSSFNRLRTQGVPLREAIAQGVSQLVRPVAMTALAAILGLLPAALSTRIGSQSQRPLAIVVVGGMVMTLFLMNLVPVLYSFYGMREPKAEASRMAH